MDVEREVGMPRSQRRPELLHPGTGQLDLLDVLHALSDPTRMTIVSTLRSGTERACGTFGVDVAPSTLTHHFRVLREAGVIRQREDGNKRWSALRTDDLQARFPGILDTIMAAYEQGTPSQDTPSQGGISQDSPGRHESVT
jgi:DNA-binding transcriptional ArsR family regulator